VGPTCQLGRRKRKRKREREPEREGCRGWAGLAGLDRPELGPGHGPGWAGHFYTLFFFDLFSHFLFLDSFTTFAKVLQFKPNFFQRFSNRLHIILSQ
jgi:hypothetical protein